MANLEQNIRWELLQKEMDFIEGTIKNLDDLIHKTKNFAFLAWGGSVYLIAQHLGNLKDLHALLYLLTAFIPLLFWAAHTRWQKHLLTCGGRKRIIAEFVNHAEFEELIIKGNELPAGKQFPFYDPVGWIYTKERYANDRFAEKYLVDDSFYWIKTAFYKDAPFFYGTMFTLSFTLGTFFCITQ